MSKQKNKSRKKDKIIATLLKKNQLLQLQLKHYKDREKEIDQLKANVEKKCQHFERLNEELAKQNKNYMQKLKEINAIKRKYKNNHFLRINDGTKGGLRNEFGRFLLPK